MSDKSKGKTITLVGFEKWPAEIKNNFRFEANDKIFQIVNFQCRIHFFQADPKIFHGYKNLFRIVFPCKIKIKTF